MCVCMLLTLLTVVAFSWKFQGQFPSRCNMGMVALEKVESPQDMESLRTFIADHHKHTGSTVAEGLLDDFGTAVTKFVKVSDWLAWWTGWLSVFVQ